MLANVCSTKWREPRVGTRQNPKERPEQRPWSNDGCLLACSLLACCVCISGLPAQGWYNPQKAASSSINHLSRKCSTDFLTGQLYRSIFSNEVFSFQMTLVGVNLNKQTNTFTSTHCNLWWPGTLYIDQNDFKLTEIWLSLLNVGIKGDHCHAWMICVGVSC